MASLVQAASQNVAGLNNQATSQMIRNMVCGIDSNGIKVMCRREEGQQDARDIREDEAENEVEGSNTNGRFITNAGVTNTRNDHRCRGSLKVCKLIDLIH